MILIIIIIINDNEHYCLLMLYFTARILHYIALETQYGGLSKSNFKDHYGDAATEQCLGTKAEINVFSVSDEML